jgi:RPA family protein
MPIQRQTAKKIRVIDLSQGTWVRAEGMEPSYVETKAGDKVARARILGTLVNRFVAEDGNFASVTLDDGTDTIRAKTFKTTKPLESLNVGDMVDMIGKIREWNDEIYMIPEIVHTVADPNEELLRRLELAANARDQAGAEPTLSEKDSLRAKILKHIEGSADGVTYADILKNMGSPEDQVEAVINELLAEGVCYEPSPGKVKKI